MQLKHFVKTISNSAKKKKKKKKETLRISSQTMKQECWWSGHLIYPWKNLTRNEHSYYKKFKLNPSKIARNVTIAFKVVNALDTPFRAPP